MWFYLVSMIFIGVALAQPSSRQTIEWDTKNFTKELQQKCYNTGNSEIFNNLQSTGALESCRVSIVDYYDNVRSSIEGNGNEIDERVVKACKTLQNSSNNCSQVAKTLMPCLSGDDQLTSVLNAILLIKPLSQYACTDDGKEVRSFIKDGGIQCIKQNSFYLFACQAHMEEKRIPFLKEKQCDQILSMEVCMNRIIENNCKKPAITDFIMSMIKVATRATPCNNFTKQFATPYAQANVNGTKNLIVIGPYSATPEPQTTDCISSSAHVLSTLRTIERKLDRDDLDSFGQYLVSSLRTFNPQLRVYAKADIQKILSKYELQAVDESVQSQPHTVPI